MRQPAYSFDDESDEDDYVDQHDIECGCKRIMLYVYKNQIFDDKRAWQKYTGAGCEGFTCLKEAKMISRMDNPQWPVVERFREDLKRVEDGEEVYQDYTDGSLLGGIAGIGVYFGENNPDNVAEQFGGDGETSQRAELVAIKAALSVIIERNSGHKYDINTDSECSINCLTVWNQGWEENGWKTAGGEDVANQDLIKAILELLKDTCVLWQGEVLQG
ncbi:Ribonuclease H [Yarrowia sp. B02]|nr:Ribonuclease H [Yarrowia sp. B02]